MADRDSAAGDDVGVVGGALNAETTWCKREGEVADGEADRRAGGGEGVGPRVRRAGSGGLANVPSWSSNWKALSTLAETCRDTMGMDDK